MKEKNHRTWLFHQCSVMHSYEIVRTRNDQHEVYRPKTKSKLVNVLYYSNDTNCLAYESTRITITSAYHRPSLDDIKQSIDRKKDAFLSIFIGINYIVVNPAKFLCGDSPRSSPLVTHSIYSTVLVCQLYENVYRCNYELLSSEREAWPRPAANQRPETNRCPTTARQPADENSTVRPVLNGCESKKLASSGRRLCKQCHCWQASVSKLSLIVKAVLPFKLFISIVVTIVVGYLVFLVKDRRLMRILTPISNHRAVFAPDSNYTTR